MKTLQTQLVEMHEQIRKLGGAVPTARGTLERQLCECRDEITRLKTKYPTRSLVESRDGKKSKTQELYEALGLTPQQAKIAARLERGVERNDLNTVFECGKLMGLSEVEARIFADPTYDPRPDPRTPTDILKEVVKR